MAEEKPLASFAYTPGALNEALEFLKRTRNELRTLRRVHIWTDRFRVYDVNGDCFEIQGVGYADPDIRPVLDAVHGVYNPDTIHQPTDQPFKEFKTGRRRAWAEDRVM